MKSTNWYQSIMPTVSSVTQNIDSVASAIAAIKGVTGVAAIGSYLTHLNQPNFPLRDIDLVAITNFDSGDLMAIDGGAQSPMKMASTEWEDYGFNPDAIRFTKQYLAIRNYNIDYWASSADGKILHWGPMPENIEAWQEASQQAEKYAKDMTGHNRKKLAKSNDTVLISWRDAYTHSINMGFNKKQRQQGWLPSDHSADEILAIAKRIK